MNKILLVSNYYSSYISAGTSKRTRELKKGLSKLGWKCKVLTIKRKSLPLSKEKDSSDITIIKTLSEKYPIPFIKNLKILDLIKSSDVVHIIDHWSILNLICVILCLLSKTPYIYSPCGALKPEGRNIFIKKIYNFFFLNLISRNASYFFAITKKEREEIKLITKSNVQIILLPNGIWKESKKKIVMKSLQNYSKLNVPSKYILFVGRLSIIKGPDILLNAFIKSKIKNEYYLIFAGPDDNMKAKMEETIKKSPNNKKVLFLGPISSTKRDFLMKKAIITVIPSRKEAMSLVALESSMVGTPFLASKFCGLDDFEENSSGYICDGDPISISKKLETLLEDLDSIKETGKNAQNYVLSHYSWESIIKKMNLYLNFLIDK
tara:strand:- start:981 stop:2114 length:1134 start_codon:yes stop_codon:yes gene_type:complete